MDINIKDLNNITLRRFYLNARMTYLGSLGRQKSERNKVGAEKYAEEMRLRSMQVPSDDEVKREGIFNGIGCF